jgi:hypothetical protein
MISRRTALQLGAVVGGVGIGGFAAQQAGVLDDGLRAVGIRPHAEPDPKDVTLLRQAAAEQADLLVALDSVSKDDGSALAELRAVLNEQLAAVSDEPPATSSLGSGGLDFTSLAERAEAAAAARADGAMVAGSLAVVKVLATMSAGLEQVAVAARRLA